jgi:hypothetical protein
MTVILEVKEYGSEEVIATVEFTDFEYEFLEKLATKKGMPVEEFIKLKVLES